MIIPFSLDLSAGINTFIVHNPYKLLFMKRLITVLLACMLLLTPSCKFMKSINPFGKKEREAEAIRKQQEAFRIADSIKVAAEQAAREKERQAEIARLAQQEAMELSRYNIIVGSFLTPEYADGWLDHVTKLGYDAKIVEMDGGRWRLVSVNSYETLKDAWNALPRYQTEVQGDAWIFKRE